MKIRVNTDIYEYMGLKKGEVVDAYPHFGNNFSFALNGKTWVLDHKDVMVMDSSSKTEEQPTKEVDMVSSPPHYILFNKDEIEGDVIEVKHVIKAILERWEKQDKISFEMYQGGCYKEMLQYLLRAPYKNNIEDVQKAKWYIDEILNEW